jgi:plasmid stabilization system protein ParE
MKAYRLSEAVAADLEAIWDYIAADDLEAADRWIDRLFAAFEQIATHPGIGHRRQDLTDTDVLFWPVQAYLVIYRAASSMVEIVAVTQGSRDVPLFLSQRGTRD